jgi:hypothetical protein
MCLNVMSVGLRSGKKRVISPLHSVGGLADMCLAYASVGATPSSAYEGLQTPSR